MQDKLTLMITAHGYGFLCVVEETDRAVVRPVAVPDVGHMHRGRVLYAEATRPMQSLYLASANVRSLSLQGATQ